MWSLIDLDAVQLRRLNSAIARIQSSSPAEQRRLSALLAALQSEKAELLRCSARGRRRASLDAAAA
jgi:hypothetical protein